MSTQGNEPREATVKVFGIVTDMRGLPLGGAEVALCDGRFGSGVIAQTLSDAEGHYVLRVKPGLYDHMNAQKDLGTKAVEYWSWDIPAYEDIEINPRIGQIEAFSMAVWGIHRGPRTPLMLYLRPMTLTRGKAWLASPDWQEREMIDIAPPLSQDNIAVTINGAPVPIHGLVKFPEYDVNGHQRIWGWVLQVELPPEAEKGITFIEASLRDPDTGDEGAGSVFWQKPPYEQKADAEGR
jgi:hypothetical protein